MSSRYPKTFVGLVAALAVLLLVLVPKGFADAGPFTLLLFVGLAALTGTRPVRFSALRVKFTISDPFVLAALGALGPLAAILAAVAAVVGAAVATDHRPRAIHLVFNLAAAVVGAAVTGGVFAAMGGTAGAPYPELLGPLTVAGVAYFFVSTGLVAVVIALDKRQPLVSTWRRSAQWAGAAYFTSLTLAVSLLVVLEHVGPWGLALGVPPCWLLMAYFSIYKSRLDEQRRRTEEVEALNAELARTVSELQEAMAHVQTLQGLLPICMHCKKIRDDSDTWHQIEAYLVQHSEVRFTHSLCQDCRRRHYPRQSRSSNG